MLAEWSAALAAKAKVAALLSGALAAGGVGGAVALAHVQPTTTIVANAADSTSTTDPETTDAQDPETTDAQDPETTDAQDPETPDAQDPESGDAYTLPECPADVKNHGEYVSSVAHDAPKGKGGVHGGWVSQAAHSDCGKKHSADSENPESGEAGGGAAGDPETGDAQDPETQDSESADAGTPDATSSHGHGHSKEHGKH